MPILQSANGLAGQTTLTVKRYEDGIELSTLTITPASACETGYIIQLSNYTANESDIAVRVVSQPALIPPPPMSLYGTLADAEKEKGHLISDLSDLAEEVFALRDHLEVAQRNTDAARRFVFDEYGVEAAIELDAALVISGSLPYATPPPVPAAFSPSFPSPSPVPHTAALTRIRPPRTFTEQPHIHPGVSSSIAHRSPCPPASDPLNAAVTRDVPTYILPMCQAELTELRAPLPDRAKAGAVHPPTSPSSSSSSSSFSFLE